MVDPYGTHNEATFQGLVGTGSWDGHITLTEDVPMSRLHEGVILVGIGMFFNSTDVQVGMLGVNPVIFDLKAGTEIPVNGSDAPDGSWSTTPIEVYAFTVGNSRHGTGGGVAPFESCLDSLSFNRFQMGSFSGADIYLPDSVVNPNPEGGGPNDCSGSHVKKYPGYDVGPLTSGPAVVLSFALGRGVTQSMADGIPIIWFYAGAAEPLSPGPVVWDQTTLETYAGSGYHIQGGVGSEGLPNFNYEWSAAWGFQLVQNRQVLFSPDIHLDAQWNCAGNKTYPPDGFFPGGTFYRGLDASVRMAAVDETPFCPPKGFLYHHFKAREAEDANDEAEPNAPDADHLHFGDLRFRAEDAGG